MRPKDRRNCITATDDIVIIISTYTLVIIILFIFFIICVRTKSFVNQLVTFCGCEMVVGIASAGSIDVTFAAC
jgi:hypothetical protein